MRLNLSEHGGRLGADAWIHDFLAKERWNEIDTRILLKMLTRTAGESVKK